MPEVDTLISEKHGGEPAYIQSMLRVWKVPGVTPPRRVAPTHATTQERPAPGDTCSPKQVQHAAMGFGSRDPSYQQADLTAQWSTCGGVGPEAWYFEVHAGSGDPSYQPPCGALDPEIPLISLLT